SFTRTETPAEELVEVPKEYKGLVFGKGGKNLMDISKNTGAQVIRRNGEVFIIEGKEEEREQARIEIKVKIAGARLRGPGNKFIKFGVHIDGLNLPENCKLKLEQVSQEDRVVIPESYTQYRLKPVKELMQQETSTPTDQANYLSNLFSDALETLRRIKQEMTTKENLKADMWCHFGKAVIRGPNQEEADRGSWSIDDATNKFKSSLGGNLWKAALKSGVKLDAKVLERHICDKTPDEYVNYAARYELAFVTPCGYQVILKVWVKKGDVGKKLEDIPAPFSDVKNILKEIEFKDETTRSRCKGWLILPSRKYLQADILFPGCAFDCRLHIRGRIDNALVADYAPKTEVIQTLARYLSDLTLTGEEGIGFCQLPEEKIPHGFHLTYRRCSKRSVYEISPGFTTILSKENSWRSDGLNKESRESTDLHLHCREWDNLLNNGDWSPEVIAATLPEFFRFVKKVQAIAIIGFSLCSFLVAVPPEILARGLAAVEAYNKALLSGKTVLKRIPLMLIGQDQAGKTSLKKSLRGIAFDPEEDSTDGIDVDPSFFNVCTETWRTGEQDEGQNSDKEISFDFQTARRIVDSLKMERKSTTVHTVTEKSSLFDSESANVEPETRNTKSSTVGENPQKSKNPAPTSSKNIPSATPDPKESNPVGNLSALDVPDEVASVAETLLQSDREENEDEVYSTFWDFAGQSVYYVTHPLFLTKKAIYFLVYDLSLKPNGKAKPLVKSGVYKKTPESYSSLKTNLDYLEFWMKSVASLASYQEECLASELLPEKLPPVILVCTHADTPYNGRDPKELATEIFGFLKDKPYGCHLYDEPFFVDNTHLRKNKSECSQVQCLRKELVSVVKELPLTHDTIPIKWLKFEKVLQVAKKGGPKYITLEAAKDIAKACDINEDTEIKTLIDYLHDLRSLIHFDDNADLNKLVVLDPQWLVDVFKRVITVKPYDRKEKEVLSLWCKLEKKGILEETLLAHVWGPLFDTKDEETYRVLIEMMMKFSLLCPWSSDGKNKSYLVPSMLRSHPPEEVLELVKKAKVPPLFVKFLNGQVPPDLFPRLVVQFCQWVKDECKILEQPQLFHEFARFITSEDGDSVILICHSSVVEVVVLRDDDSHKLAKHLSASMTLSTDVQVETTKLIYASDVHRQLVSILERMRNESRWQRDMSYKISFLCPVCSPEGAVSYCQTHSTKKCKEEECLHFLCESELRGAKKLKVCPKASFAPNLRVQVEMFEPWFAPLTEQGSGLPSSDGTTKEARVRSIPENCARELNITLLASEWSSSMGGLSTLNRKLAVLLAKQPQVSVTVLVPQNACSEEDKKNASQSNVTIQEAKVRPGYDDLDWLCSPPKSLLIDVIVGHGAKLGKQAQFFQSDSCKWVQMVHTVPEELGIYKEYRGAVTKGEKKNRVEVELCKLADLVVAGYDIAPKALAELRNSSYCLVFVGTREGKQDEVKERLLESGIPKGQLFVREFIQSKEGLKDLFCEVDLAIMPSRTEGFGLTGLEALSAGLPILVSGNSGLGHALRALPQGHSFVMDSEDPNDWAKAIASVRQKERAQRLKEIQSLRTSYEETYNWDWQCTSLIEKLWSLTKGELSLYLFYRLLRKK
ncbi:unnamed protein product, partial [Porites evermanni]